MRTHWYKSQEAPRFGQDLVAMCGQIVPKAEPVKAIWDNTDEDGLVNCRKCMWARWQLGERYAAVITEGQEAMDEERKAG